MDARNRIVLGSRGSQLALAQASMVEMALQKAWPGLDVGIEIIRTSGDEGGQGAPILDQRAGRKGMFTREIEKGLLSRQIDVAVHSAKDLPSEQAEELELAATLPRANTDDVLVTKEGIGLTSIMSGATIATGSVRRQRQLRWKRPDLNVVDVRGNVPTRLRKLCQSPEWSGLILARAGLERLGIVGPDLGLLSPKNELQAADAGSNEDLRCMFALLSAEDFLPAGGQGIIALQIRREDENAKRLLSQIDHQTTHLCLRAERDFLRLLHGDCDSPVGVQARWSPNELTLRAQVFSAEEAAPRVGRLSGGDGDPEMLATKLMQQMYGR